MPDESLPLVGAVVWCTVVLRAPWGLVVELDDWPNLSASIDMGHLDRLSSDLNDYPPPGERLEVVVGRVDEADWREPMIRLSHLPEHVVPARPSAEPI